MLGVITGILLSARRIVDTVYLFFHVTSPNECLRTFKKRRICISVRNDAFSMIFYKEVKHILIV